MFRAITTMISEGPPPWWSWLLAPLVAFLLYVGLTDMVTAIRLSRVPGVRASSLARTPFGAMLKMAMMWVMHMQNRLVAYFTSFFDHLGPSDVRCVEMTVFGERFIFTDEPEHVKELLSSSFATYGKGNKFRDSMLPFLGNSIFTTDAEPWRRSRGLMRPMFVKEQIQNMELYDSWTETLLAQMPSPGETVDICDLFYRFTMDVTTNYLLGQSFNSLENPDHEFSEAFDHVQYKQTSITLLGPLAFIFPKGSYHRGIKVLDAYVEPLIEATLAIGPSDLEKLSESGKGMTFLHHIAMATQDRTAIRDQIVSVLLAGRDTTASILSWTLFEISGYPEIWKRLRDLVLDKIGPIERPSHKDIKELTYLTHCLNESMRLYPVLFSNSRTALGNTRLPGKPGQPDIAVLEGDTVMYNIWSMHRRRGLYPPVSEHFADPLLWSPDRWEHWQPTPWQFVPFNGGPRICIGQEFAMTEMAFVMIRLLQKYERVEYRGDRAAQYYRVNLIGRPGMGVPVAFYEAEPQEL